MEKTFSLMTLVAAAFAALVLATSSTTTVAVYAAEFKEAVYATESGFFTASVICSKEGCKDFKESTGANPNQYAKEQCELVGENIGEDCKKVK
jgi:hypothetical protein